MIISSLTLKGGSGKSTIALNLAVGFARKKNKVLVIDTDRQQSLSNWSEARPKEKVKIEVISISEPELLQEKVKTFGHYDIIIIDGTPAICEMATVSAAISDLVLFPISPSMFDIWAAGSIMTRVAEVQKVAPDIKTAIVANKMVTRSKQATKLLEALGEIDEHYVFTSTLGNRVAYSDSVAAGLSVLEWSDPKAKKEITELTKEIIKYMKKGE